MFKIHPAIHPKIHLKIQEIGSREWLRELSSQGISSQLSNFPRCQLLGFLASDSHL